MPQFVDFENPYSRDRKFTQDLPVNLVLFNRRNHLNLTQQQVADMAKIPLRQYQRLENGDVELANTPMSAGLAVCAALLLDPYYFFPLDEVQQADPITLKPQNAFDSTEPLENEPKRVGRKPIRRDIMTVYVNHEFYSAIVTKDVLKALGSPAYLRLYWKADERRLLFCAADASDDSVFDVPPHLYDEESGCTALVFPSAPAFEKVREELGWDNDLYAVECRLVKDKQGNKLILCDLNTAQPSAKFAGPFAIPACLDDGSDEEGEEE